MFEILTLCISKSSSEEMVFHGAVFAFYCKYKLKFIEEYNDSEILTYFCKIFPII